MKYTVYHRPQRVGGGWFIFKTFEAESPAAACDLAFPRPELGLPSKYNPGSDGTPNKWFYHANMELCAVPEGTKPDDAANFNYEVWYRWFFHAEPPNRREHVTGN